MPYNFPLLVELTIGQSRSWNLIGCQIYRPRHVCFTWVVTESSLLIGDTKLPAATAASSIGLVCNYFLIQ